MTKGQQAPSCEHCGGTGEYFAHSEDCQSDLCALNGDEHSCGGRVEKCACRTAALVVFGTYAEPELRTAAGELVASLPTGALATARKLAALWNAALAAPPAPLEDVSMPQHWSVTVNVDGESILSIGEYWLSGSRQHEDADEKTILGAAQHLLSFIGYGLPPSSFDPDAEEAAQARPHEDQAQPQRQAQAAQRETLGK